MKTTIIGAGVAGIASAIRLAAQGHEVDVYESNTYPGGKLSEIRCGKYRFDAGPSLFTMPMYVDELFELLGENPREHFNYNRLDNVCNYFWEDGTRLSAFAEKDEFTQELQTQLGVPPDVLDRALDDSRLKYELTGRMFLERPLHKWRSWLSSDVPKALIRLPSLDIFKTMHEVNRRRLKHPKLVQFFDRFATYNGSDPYQASGILNIIPHFEHHFGAYFPKGGMINITRSLYALAERQGVRFHFNKKVDRILVEGKRIKGIRVADTDIPADVVVSNMDILPTYRHLLPDQKHPHRILESERSSSALILYWGIRRSFPELDLHNILFSNDYEREFKEMARGGISDDPTIYIHISSKLHPSDAPPDCENWFTMINVPYDAGQDWDVLITKAKQNILAKLQRILGMDIAPLIECEDLLSPQLIQALTSSSAGALYGTSSNDRMAAFRRHPNFSKDIKGLYFCGGSVHPGGGVPLCLLSAKIMSEVLENDFG